MYPGAHVATRPDHAAVIMAGSGEQLTYAELEARSVQLARRWREHGLRRGDHVALVAENHIRYFEVYWAAMRSGLYLTAVNRYLAPEEAAYVIGDCGARSVVCSHAVADLAAALTERMPAVDLRLMFGGTIAGWASYEDEIAGMPVEPLADQPRGATMLYSSGTTGRPKGIKRPLPDRQIDEPAPGALVNRFGMDAETRYLSPAPLYHAAPLGFTSGVQALGGTVVVMERFDPVDALAAIERYAITHSQWVPTMFVRMLKLPEAERARFDLSSHRVAVHAAAPCPVEVKRAMIDWWGPILHEYYAGTEGNGMTVITSEEWLEHPGSVGRAATGTVHICADDGAELPLGEAGTVYFEQARMPFEYHGDPAKTRSAQHPVHPNWSTLGDVGYLDDDGYLYLTDRKAFMIISGGVNIYPQEIEDCLIMHPAVADVAVFGLPDDDMGERVHAVVQAASGHPPGADLAEELMEFAHSRLARYKLPRQIDFIDELPRLPTGKLYKRQLRDSYLAGAETATT